jgi:formate dehydrogenase subunit gamma
VQYPGSRPATAGEAWRQVRNQRLIPYGGALLLLALGAIALFHIVKGPIGRRDTGGGRERIERFTRFERTAHWANAAAFCALAISGLVMAFGKFFLLPLVGGGPFAVLAYLLKTLHNVAGPVFALSLAVVFVTFVRDNRPQRGDLQWLLKGGGLFGRAGAKEPPSHRFNAGEKLIFWLGVLLLGALVVGSGLVMDRLVPGLDYERASMQVAHLVHAASAVLILCIFAAHIYMGTIGMRGAYAAMRSGWVSEEWAIEHHAHWYQEVRAGRQSAHRRRGPPDSSAARLGAEIR